MQGKKLVILFLALLLPGCIFLFLKIFGKNEFDVPPLHDQGIEVAISPCEIDGTKPYRIPDNDMKNITSGIEAPLYLVNFSNDSAVVERVENEVRDRQVVFRSDSILRDFYRDYDFFKQCILLLRAPNDIVLIDDQNRIRGYYNSKDRDEVDRLLVEINIILKNY